MKKTALQKHVEFFDLNNDGYIMPWETYTGFRRLGNSILNSIVSALIINLSLSYSSQDSWIPDPLFSIKIKNIHRCKHTCESGVFDSEGEIDQKNLDEFFEKFSNKNDIKFSDVKKIITYPEGVSLRKTLTTFWGLLCGRLEWKAATELVTNTKGRIKVEDLKKIIDGSFFEEAANYLKEKKA